jgi:hypothetical protein
VGCRWQSGPIAAPKFLQEVIPMQNSCNHGNAVDSTTTQRELDVLELGERVVIELETQLECKAA